MDWIIDTLLLAAFGDVLAQAIVLATAAVLVLSARYLLRRL